MPSHPARWVSDATAPGRRGRCAAPRQGDYDGLCWGIEPWNARKVEAELRKRGLTPVADNHKDFESFHVKDPDGFNLQISNGRLDLRQQPPANGKTSATAPFEPTNWKTVWLDHISFEVSNYKETVAFYTALLGWAPGVDEGSQNQCEIGDIGDVTVRRRRGTQASPPVPGVVISHLSFGISPFEPRIRSRQSLKSAGCLCKRGHWRERRYSFACCFIQKLSHGDAERIQSADQCRDEGDPHSLVLGLGASCPPLP